jgi:NAD-dependent deacetylase
MSALVEAAHLLRGKERVVVFTGAGISRESGIDTFRDLGGLWERYPVDAFATPGGLLKTAIADPQKLAAFLRDVLAPVARARPNPAHGAVHTLERYIPRIDVITQNVDGLHHDAGSDRVHEVHGSLFAIVDKDGRPVRRLLRDEAESIASHLDKISMGRFVLPRLIRAASPFLGLHPTKGVTHRPNIVLFGEQLAEPDWERAQKAAQRCDAMIVVGTSGTVYPAATLPDLARDRGVPIIGVGPEEDIEANVWLHGAAGEILPALVREAFP